MDETDRICQDWEEAPEDIKQQYPTLIKYATQYYGCSRIPGKSNSFGYLTNPKSKWDWYQIGGGWAGALTIPNKNRAYTLGKTSWRSDDNAYNAPTGELKVDGCYVRDLVDNIDKIQARIAKINWKKAVKNEELTPEEEQLASILLYKKEYYLENFQTEEKYIKYCSLFSTFAVIDEDGCWNEGGEMGWFGCCSEHDELAWQDKCRSLIFDGLDSDPERYITIVDCHI